MVTQLRNKGFSLVEVMISAGILAIGFVLIAGAFPVGAKLTAIATERTIGLAASQEAFAKIRLYGVDDNDIDWPGLSASVNYGLVASAGTNLDYNVLAPDPPPLVAVAMSVDALDQYNYPSTNIVDKKKYRWSALCRDLSGGKVQVTVFVCRLTGFGAVYPEVDRNGALSGLTTGYPAALKIMRDDPDVPPGSLELTDNIIKIDTSDPAIDPDVEIEKYVTVGSTLVDDRTGTLMYVTGWEDTDPGNPENPIIITLLNPVDETQLGDYFWVIPPSVKPDLTVAGRYPCVEIYQRVITF